MDPRLPPQKIPWSASACFHLPPDKSPEASESSGWGSGISDEWKCDFLFYCMSKKKKRRLNYWIFGHFTDRNVNAHECVTKTEAQSWTSSVMRTWGTLSLCVEWYNNILSTAHCTLYTAQYTVHTIQHTLSTINYIQDNTHYTIHYHCVCYTISNTVCPHEWRTPGLSVNLHVFFLKSNPNSFRV